MTDAAMGNIDFNFLRSQLSGVISEWKKFCTGGMYCKTLNLSHGSSVFLYRD